MRNRILSVALLVALSGMPSGALAAQTTHARQAAECPDECQAVWALSGADNPREAGDWLSRAIVAYLGLLSAETPLPEAEVTWSANFDSAPDVAIAREVLKLNAATLESHGIAVDLDTDWGVLLQAATAYRHLGSGSSGGAAALEGLGVVAVSDLNLTQDNTTEAIRVITAANDQVAKETAARAESEKKEATEKAAAKAKKDAAKNTFLGFQWSLGLGVTGDFGGEDQKRRVDKAKVVGGIVRVEEEKTNVPRLVLEVHRLFPVNKKKTFGVGPFVAIQTSSAQVLDAFALGGAMGWRSDQNASSSLNVGLGLLWDRAVQVLGDGIEADQALPDGETEIRFKKESRFGWLLMASFSF